MSLIKSLGDSNASPGNPNQEVNTGDGSVGMCGYVQQPFPAAMPARKNTDIAITGDFKASMVNQGTSLTSYGEQPETISAESGGGDDQETSGK